jgi:hypothetical protein
MTEAAITEATMPAPLEGIKVVEIATYVAGPQLVRYWPTWAPTSSRSKSRAAKSSATRGRGSHTAA